VYTGFYLYLFNLQKLNLKFVVDEWKNDIIDKQLRNLVGGVAMINAVVLLAQGLSDLVTYPLEGLLFQRFFFILSISI